LADAAAGDRGGLDAHQRLAAAAGPGLDVTKSDDLLPFGRLIDESCAAGDENAPAFAHRLVNVVGFEADGCAGCWRARLRCRGEDDVAVGDAEVDRKRDRPLLGEEDEAADAVSR
jgi:hypothetical protein